ncbi:MAG TPA: zf-HC2 domain-containing protein [Steroidobacteraceae bacterium]|nr:zf-HC2 domain-containing protein [Steroidobacteraceae bacterium]
MSPRIPDTHAEAWDLLPWLANGRIQPADREWVEAHVQACAECRAELSSQRMLATNLRDPGAGTQAMNESSTSEEQRSFDKLWARIEAAEAAAPAAQTSGLAPRRVSRPVRWLAAAVVVQGIGLALFGFNALRSAGPGKPGYITVTREAPVRSNAPMVSVVFEPGASIDTVNTLLTHQGLSIVSGPGLSGNFTAALSADAVASGASAESVAAVISKDPNVTFAQPIAR